MRKIIHTNIEKIKILISSVDLIFYKIYNNQFTLLKNSLETIKYSAMKIIEKKEYSKPLGRWNIDYCNKKINKKVDLSNEDHCGPCGQYIISKNAVKSKI